jgi:hypothetical protein
VAVAGWQERMGWISAVILIGDTLGVWQCGTVDVLGCGSVAVWQGCWIVTDLYLVVAVQGVGVAVAGWQKRGRGDQCGHFDMRFVNGVCVALWLWWHSGSVASVLVYALHLLCWY